LEVFSVVVAQDLFLERHGSAMQSANPSDTNLTSQLAIASGDSWWKTFTPDGNHNLCLDVPGGNAFNGNPLWLWECNGQDSQIWVFDSNNQIRFGADETFCVDAGDMSNGFQLMLWDCNYQDQQTWGYDSAELKIYVLNTGTCVDWYDGDSDNGQAFHIWECNGLSNQRWDLWDSGAPGGGGGGGANFFPSDHCMYDTGTWPSFNTQSDLQNDQYWSAYFTRIYGGVPSSGYPICPGAFQMLWQIAADTTGVASAPVDCAGGMTGKGQELGDGTYYTGQSFLEARDVYGFIYNSNLMGVSVPAHTWGEVTHTAFPGDVGAIWYYMAVGSGVWINAGSTAVYEDHPDAMSDMLKSSCHDQSQDHGSTPTECENDFPNLYKEARSRSLNTIQFTGHHDCTCGPEGTSSYMYKRLCQTEIIFLDDPKAAKNGCTSFFKGGWEASSGCNCDESFKSRTKDPNTCLNSADCSYSNCGAF